MLSRNIYCCLPALVAFIDISGEWKEHKSMGLWKSVSLVRGNVLRLFLISFKMGIASFILHNTFDNSMKTKQCMKWSRRKTNNSNNKGMRRRLEWGGRKWPRCELLLNLEFKVEVLSVFMWLSLVSSTPPSISNCVPGLISNNFVTVTVKLSLHSGTRCTSYRNSKLNIKAVRLKPGHFKILCRIWDFKIHFICYRRYWVVSTCLIFGRQQVQVSKWKLPSWLRIFVAFLNSFYANEWTVVQVRPEPLLVHPL